MKRWILAFIFLLVLDFATKTWALHSLAPLSYGVYPFGGIGIFSVGGVTFSLNFITNTGAAWGFFAGYPGWLFALRLLIIFSLLFFVPKRRSLGLVITGAIGNAIDYCLYGHVIDFLHFTFWNSSFPIFNVADACITVGILLLLFTSPRTQWARSS